MSIALTTPISGASSTTVKVTAIALRIYSRSVVLIFGTFDASGALISERRFELTDATTPSLQDYLTACPAAGNLRKQTETFASTLDATLGGTVT